MSKLADRVKDSTTSTGTGTIQLSNAPSTGYQTFFDAFNPGADVTFVISDSVSGLWEVSEGEYAAVSSSLSRRRVLDGSSGPNVLVNFTAGTKDVFITEPAKKLMATHPGSILARINGLAMP